MNQTAVYVSSCQMCGVAVLGFGVYMMVNFKMTALTPTLASFNFANMLLISGIVITCVSFLGFLGALKENRCLLLTVWHTAVGLLCCCSSLSANLSCSEGSLQLWRRLYAVTSSQPGVGTPQVSQDDKKG